MAGADHPHAGVWAAGLAGVGCRPAPASGPWMAQAEAMASSDGLRLMRGGGCVLSQVSLGLGALLWDPGPNRKRASQTGCQLPPPLHPPPHLGRLAFLNLSFLHCKRGTKAPILAGMCDFGRLTGGSDPACSRSCSEDRGPGWCRERAEQSSSRTCLGLPGLSPVASPTLYDFPSLPLSSPRDNQNSQAPFPLHREGN